MPGGVKKLLNSFGDALREQRHADEDEAPARGGLYIKE